MKLLSDYYHLFQDVQIWGYFHEKNYHKEWKTICSILTGFQSQHAICVKMRKVLCNTMLTFLQVNPKKSKTAIFSKINRMTTLKKNKN